MRNDDDIEAGCENSDAPYSQYFARHLDSLEGRRVLAEVRRRLLGDDDDDGDIMIGDYKIIRRVGFGGMGEVYLCEDPTLERQVAVKRILGEVCARGREQLRREALALARLRHANVIRIYDSGEDDSGPFFVMEYIEGQTFADWNTDAPFDDVLDHLIAAGRGLEAAHAHHLVHRDFKASNILIGDDGDVKVADFGLAADRRPIFERTPNQALDADATEELEGQAGTVSYMAPEQLRGRQGDVLSDQYSFCLVAYEALWSRRPFDRRGEGEARAERAHHRIVTPKDHRPAFEVLRRGLSFDPGDRWPSMTELLGALEETRREPAKRRQRLARGLMYVSSVTVFFIALQQFFSPAPSCEAKLERVLPETTRLELDAALSRIEATARHGPDSRARFEASLDAWVRAWTDEYGAMCELIGDAKPDEVEGREQCLAKAARRFDSMAEQIIAGDADTLAKAVVSVEQLPDPAACVDFAGLEPPPRAVRLAALTLGRDLDDARTARLLGRWQEARARAATVAGLAEGLGYAPLLAEALAERGKIEDVSGKPRAADELYASALALAETEGQDRLAAEILIERAELTLHGLDDPDNAMIWLSLARAKSERFELDTRARARLAYISGDIAHARGDIVGATRELNLAIALVGEWAPELPNYLDTLAFVVEDERGSLALRRRAMELSGLHFGERHPQTAKRLYNYGAALQDYDGSGGRERQIAAEIWAECQSEPSLWQAQVAHDFAARALLRGALDDAERHTQAMAEILDRVAATTSPDRGEPELLLAQIEAIRADGGGPDDEAHHRREAVLHARRALMEFRRVHPSAARDPRKVSARALLGNQLMELGQLDEAEAEFDAILAEPRARPADLDLARLRRAELALRKGDLAQADLDLVQLQPGRAQLGLERLSYEVLRSIVDHRLARLDADQRAALREARSRAPTIDAVLGPWLDRLGVAASERQAIGL